MKYKITHTYKDYIIIEKYKYNDNGFVVFNFNKNLYLLSEYDGKEFKVNFKYDFEIMSIREDVVNYINNYGE